VDAIVDGVTGAIVPLGDVNALAGALARYLRDADLRRAHGAAARERVLREFRQEPLWEAMRANYAALLRKPAGANGPVVFIIPIKSAKMSKDWKLTSQLFERCLRSICRQTAPEFRVVVVCNERPVTEFTHPNVHYVAVDFPPPLADTGERTTGYEFGTSEKIKRQNADKARRIRTGYEYAERFHPTHSMVVDADDCVSRRLVEHVLRQPADRGWIFRKGYLYPEGGRLLYYNVRNFNQICGSSVIVPFAHRDTLVQNPDFYDHSLDVLPPAANLTPLPFVGAVYSIANGDNIYMSAETKGSIGRSLFRRIFSKDILALVKKILKYRPALLTPGTRAEFGLYKLA
jgi:hypothetical protein